MIGIPSYGCPPAYDVTKDPLYRPDRKYGPGYPFVSPAHEAWEANRLRVTAWIAEEVKRRMKLISR